MIVRFLFAGWMFLLNSCNSFNNISCILFPSGFNKVIFVVSFNKKVAFSSSIIIDNLEGKLYFNLADLTQLFFSISFYGTGVPWITLSLGDLGVKIFIALIMLVPFRLLLGTLKPV